MKGEVVKGVLKKHGVNIRDLASRLGMTNQNVSQLLGKDDIKTGRLYDIRVWPQAAALINQYRGEEHLLCIADRYRSSRDYTQHINAGLKKLIPEPPFNHLSTYYARHSWATIAYNELGASMETISAALGHQYGSRITSVYINPDTRKVDKLNRRMLNLIFAL